VDVTMIYFVGYFMVKAAVSYFMAMTSND